jgi:ABC-type taurine transport system ATPase subunit
MGGGITAAEELEVGHQNIKEVELGGMHSANAPPISGGYNQVVSIGSISVFDKWRVVDWKMLVLDKEALSSGVLQPTDLDIAIILTEAEK